MQAWRRWQDWVTLAVGVALIAMAFIAGEARTEAVATVTVLGIVMGAASLVALARPEMMAERWVVGAAGILLVIAPWAVGYADLTALAWSSWIGGAITVIMEALALPEARRAGGPQPHA